MESFKVDNYERVNGLGSFPAHRHLSGDEARCVLARLRQRVRLSEKIDKASTPVAIRDMSHVVRGVNADNGNFDLRDVLSRLRFNVSQAVFLVWSSYDDIDEMKAEDLISTFSDIWYPSSDDLDIIDGTMQWIVSIDHNGTVRALSVGKMK